VIDTPCPQCTPCPKGSWTQSSIGAAAECNACGTGTYSVTLGATTSEACTACAGGTFSVSTRADQVSVRVLVENINLQS